MLTQIAFQGSPVNSRSMSPKSTGPGRGRKTLEEGNHSPSETIAHVSSTGLESSPSSLSRRAAFPTGETGPLSTFSSKLRTRWRSLSSRRNGRKKINRDGQETRSNASSPTRSRLENTELTSRDLALEPSPFVSDNERNVIFPLRIQNESRGQASPFLASTLQDTLPFRSPTSKFKPPMTLKSLTIPDSSMASGQVKSNRGKPLSPISYPKLIITPTVYARPLPEVLNQQNQTFIKKVDEELNEWTRAELSHPEIVQKQVMSRLVGLYRQVYEAPHVPDNLNSWLEKTINAKLATK